MLRYRSTGELHKDFHRLTCNTLHYLLENFGEEAVKEVLRSTAQEVYKTIHEKLCAGDASELAEFWEYYLTREQGSFSLETLADGIRLTVSDCPMLRHLVKSGSAPDPVVCRATEIFNAALCENSPFVSSLEKTGEFSCIQTVKKERAK